MTPLAIAIESLARLEAMRPRCRVVAPERLETLEAATEYFRRVVALLSRHPDPSPWDLVLIETWCTKSNDLLGGFVERIN